MDTITSNTIHSVKDALNQNTNAANTAVLQNHIYGCFVVLELIAEGSDIIFGANDDFEKIGINYGFIDTSCLTDDIISKLRFQGFAIQYMDNRNIFLEEFWHIFFPAWPFCLIDSVFAHRLFIEKC